MYAFQYMCGISGIIGLKDISDATARITRMTDNLAHRGPDATGLFIDENIALGHLRLSIIDLSESANQPMFDESNRFVIIFNGEIYNFREIKQKIPDYPFQTDSDTEVILAAYAKFGPECLAMFNGMFALAIWDKQTRELFIARDRLGVKPLFYALTDDLKFIFASEIRAILSSELVDRKIDPSGLYNYLMFQAVYAPHSIVANISQLPAGSYGIFAVGRLTIKPFWQIENNLSEALEEPPQKIKSNVRELLLKSVERRLISDVSLGAFLSGGIDSSAIVALMAEVSANPVETFSVTFAEKQFDESEFSALVARKFKTRHTSIRLSAADFLDELPNALRANDSPSGDGLNTYVVSKATRRAGIKVALSGLGGDELFAGYPNFLKWFQIKTGLLAKSPRWLRIPFGSLLMTAGNSRYQRIGALINSANYNISSIYPLTRQVMSEQMIAALLPSGNNHITIKNTLAEKLSKISEFPLLSQFSIAEILGYTENVLLKDTDQFSMASALEVREPFFDYQLIEYVLRIPDQIKYPKYPKSLLVESLAPLLPEKIVHRPKMGFVLPFENWMRNELRDFCRLRIDNLAARQILDADLLRRKWSDFQNGKKGVLWSHLWHLIVLTEWLENNKF